MTEITCPCGSIVKDIKRHVLTKKHYNYLQSLKTNKVDDKAAVKEDKANSNDLIISKLNNEVNICRKLIADYKDRLQHMEEENEHIDMLLKANYNNRMFLTNLTTRKISNDRTCAICQDIIKKGTNIYQIPCRHKFHMHCLVLWLLDVYKPPTCPICRTNNFEE